MDATLDASSAEAKELLRAADREMAFDQTLAGQGGIAPGQLASPLPPIENWDRYEILGLLGQGGMGAVYKARDRRLGRILALKFIRGVDVQMTARFMQEARAQSRVDHSGICRVLDVGEVQGRAFIAMEFVEGSPLQQASRNMSLAEKVQVVRDTAEALHAAHELGIIHRDIKPSNIMVERVALSEGSEGSVRFRPVVMDFGLAREAHGGNGLTESGAVLGTPGYMSPEQARGDVRRTDRRTDVYSLGATLYELLSGHPPFEDESVVNILLKVLSDDALPLRKKVPDIPEALDTIVGKCLNKEASQRYPTAMELANDLGRFLRNQRIVGRNVGIFYRLQYQARRNKTVAVLASTLLLSLLVFAIYGVRNRIQSARKERLEKRKAELAQRLGREMKDMEWLLRIARGMPLHDLTQEKDIVRQKIAALQNEFSGFGDEGRPLAHYALGRGHMSLHEYAAALSQIEQAIAQGFQHPDAYYALGVVFGKHYEQAMHEARLAGGGDWAKKRLRDIEPKYLRPAIMALQVARNATSETPEYLEGLIAFYQRDFGRALGQAQAALRRAPWLHEANKLAGDVHLERALEARDNGQDAQAETEFAAAVHSYSEAAAVGSSDGEIYEGLAEAWVRQLEMAAQRGRPAPTAYAAAVAASDKLRIVEPQSVSAALKTAYASLMSLGFAGTGNATAERSRQCLAAAEDALQRQPGHPYASDVAAACYAMEAYRVQGAGQDPEPLLRKALGLLEPAVRRAPHFLWGLNDLGNIYLALSNHLQLHGQPAAREYFSKAVDAYWQAVKLDASYQIGYVNILSIYIPLVPTIRVEAELERTLSEAREVFKKCTAINAKNYVCHNNYFQICSAAAARLFDWEKDPRASLQCAFETLRAARQMGASGLDTEQADVALQLTAAKDQVRRGDDPTSQLKRAADALPRCFTFAAQDANCRGLDAQIEWARSEWQARHGESPLPALNRALAKAMAATQSPETNPEAWWTLAETHRRLAEHSAAKTTARTEHIAEGLAAARKVFAINPNHARGWAVRGALELAQARSSTPKAMTERALAAQNSLERAFHHDPILPAEYVTALAQAKVLTAKR